MKRRNFGQFGDAFVRIVYTAMEREVAHLYIGEDESTEITTIFGEIHPHGTEWKLRSVGAVHAGVPST